MLRTRPTPPSADRSGTSAARRHERPLTRWAIVLSVLVLIVAGAEIGARQLEPHVPAPLDWASVEMQTKVAQMDARREAGLVGGIVVSGSSQSVGIDPMVLVQTGVAPVAYNSGVPGALAIVQERWLLEEVVPRLAPDHVVLGVGPQDLVDDPNTMRASYDSARATRDDRTGRLERWLSDRSALLRLRPRLRGAEAIATTVTDDRRSLPPSYAPDGARVGDVTHGGLELTITKQGRWRFGLSGPSALRTIARELDARGITLTFLFIPPSPSVADIAGRGRDNLTDARALIRDLADELGVEVVDVTDRYPDDAAFRDPAHLTLEHALDATHHLAVRLGGRAMTQGDPPPTSFSVASSKSDFRAIVSPQRGWIDVTTTEPLAGPRRRTLTISTLAGDTRERITIEIDRMERRASLERFIDGRWAVSETPRVYLLDASTVRVQLDAAASPRGEGEVSITVGDADDPPVTIALGAVARARDDAPSIPLDGLVQP